MKFKRNISIVKADSCHFQQENNRLVKGLKEVRSEVVDMQWCSGKINLEMKGIRSTQEQNLFETMQAICSSLSEDIKETDIEVLQRLQKKDKAK